MASINSSGPLDGTHLLFCLNSHRQNFLNRHLIPFIKKHLPQVQISYVYEFKQAQHKMDQINFATVIVQDTSHKKQHLSSLDFLIDLKKNFPDTSRILYTKNLKFQEIINYINQAYILDIFSPQWELNKILILIQKSIDQYRICTNRMKLVEEITHINKKLEINMQQLETHIKEGTQYIKEAQLDAQKKKHKAERLVHLVQKLGEITDFEEYLIALKMEYKSWHCIITPFLIVQHIQDQFIFYQLQGRTIKKQHLPWPQKNILLNAFRKELANLIGRPLGQLLQISLGEKGVLIFEHIFEKKELEDFKEHIELNRQALEIAFQRILQDSQLIEATKVWQKTFDVISDPIAIVDNSHQILRCNQSFHKHQLSTYDLKRSSLNRHIIANNKLFEVSCFPIDIKSHNTHTVYIYKDITHSKTLHLQMIQNEKMAALGHLAGNITHELNNPLTGLKALAQILAQEVKDQPQLYQDIIDIKEGVQRSQDVIKNLLEFTSPHTSLNISKIEIDDLVKKTLPFLKTATRFHKLNIHLQSKGAYIKAVPQLIQHVIFNLINNSCQAIKKLGEISIITEVQNNKDKDFVKLKISDNGPGIPEELREQIFLPFATTKQKNQGTGLGLHLCKNIVEKYQGEIFYNKEFKQGAEFIVQFPCVF